MPENRHHARKPASCRKTGTESVNVYAGKPAWCRKTGIMPVNRHHAGKPASTATTSTITNIRHWICLEATVCWLHAPLSVVVRHHANLADSPRSYPILHESAIRGFSQKNAGEYSRQKDEHGLKSQQEKRKVD